MVESPKKSPKKTNPSEDHMITMQKLITKKIFDLESLQKIYPQTKKKHITLAKFNIAPAKWWLEDYFPLGKVTFQGLC